MDVAYDSGTMDAVYQSGVFNVVMLDEMSLEMKYLQLQRRGAGLYTQENDVKIFSSCAFRVVI